MGGFSELEPSIDELSVLRRLSRALDDALEESLKARETLERTFRRVLPVVLRLTGAAGAAVVTRDEELFERAYSEGELGGAFAAGLLAQHPWGVHRYGEGTLASQGLDVVGVEVGRVGLWFEGDLTSPSEAARIGRLLDAVAEQLDTVLISIQTAAEKHQLVLGFNQHLANPVFEHGMDQAVLALAQQVRIPGFILLYRDAVDIRRLHYRTYRAGHLEHESGAQGLDSLDEAIRLHGPELISVSDRRLSGVVGGQRTTEAVLISGPSGGDPLGKILLWSPADEGFSRYALDLVELLASTLSQRLVDYNRERVHLSQFFPAAVIDALLEDPDYRRKYLTPRDEQVGILFADINGFTRICEQVLETPSNIGGFVDRWSEGVVERLWHHGGVFDKMVGDCVIGLFGPPFFRSSLEARAEAAVRAAIDIQRFTVQMSADQQVARIAERVKLPGLGVAIGINLAHTYCGMFGPNRAYTGFSTGMNQTARLQSLGGFREVLVMEPVRQALSHSADPFLQGLQYGELTETPVKNVSQPLRHFRLSVPD